ncbi:uncharacterized protein LOC100371719 [Saccoglossus kowalevskii]|uniref:Receptor-binding cancer antigen expressed on SiSo cells-like n=1 Tax=Saccoglossus kowalevskii TaxID=10224 RepID=A0ABM0GP98_SACKO|nr:PREDICTED: receptor-binding cancer antigen expressed on SiSo cells-like [Saccoglossus kowalevskii]
MKVVQFNLLKICSIFTIIYGLFKRAMCLMKRRRNSDALPVSMNSLSVPDNTTHDIPSTEPIELQDWDDWGGENGPTSIRVDSGQPNEESEEPEVDFFAEMAPKIKKPPIIRKKVETSSFGFPNRLSMDAGVIPQTTSELETWNEYESNAWEDETAGNVSSWEVEQVMKETKMQEREKRMMETQRKKLEREAHKSVKKDSGKLATKLS